MTLYRDVVTTNLYEVIKIETCSGKPLEVNTASGQSVAIQPAGVAGDAFGRFRVSEPFTLFDSSHRFSVNGDWTTDTAESGEAVFNSDQGLVDLSITTTSGSKVYRETNKVFPYQPGKSLLAMMSFVMAPKEENLRQRVGYFGVNNGIYIEQVNNTLSIVKRSYVSGSIVNTVISQDNWNKDKLDGSGKSGNTLDISKAQIFWVDFEWLGVGTVRAGFVINGQFIVCHSFDHANIIDSTYITTATLPLRYEIEALDTLDVAATLKEICATVISEGGYELQGQSKSIATPITGAYTFTTSGVDYPIAAIRLKTSSGQLDSVVVPNALSFIGEGNNGVFNWKVIAGGTVSGGSWSSTASNSSVDYNLSGTSISGGDVLAQGFVSSSVQSKTTLEIETESLFKYQLKRNSFTATPTEFAFVVASKVNDHTGFAGIDWEEITT